MKKCPKCGSVNVDTDENNVCACGNCGYVNYAEAFGDRQRQDDWYDDEYWEGPAEAPTLRIRPHERSEGET